MKNTFLIAIILALLFVFSCDKKEMGPKLELVKAPVLTQPDSTSFILSDDVSTDTILRLKWTKAEYNIETEIYYTIEIAEAGTNFTNSAVLVSDTYADSATVTAFDLNKCMTVDLNFTVGDTAEIELRVNSYVGKSEPSPSNSSSITAITYDPPYTPETVSIMSGETEIKVLNILDDYVGNSVTISETGMYEGYVWLTAGSSVTLKGGYDPILNREPRTFGSSSSTTAGQVTTFVLAEGADPITLSEDGYYRFKVFMNQSKVEVIKTEWGVIGSAIPPYDWSTSVVMTYYQTDDVWTIEVGAEAAQFKFRPNQTWNPLNYGDGHNDHGMPVDGVPDEYGTNIDIDAGTKIITLDLSEYPYSYTVENAKK